MILIIRLAGVVISNTKLVTGEPRDPIFIRPFFLKQLTNKNTMASNQLMSLFSLSKEYYLFRRLSFLGRWPLESPTAAQLATAGWYLLTDSERTPSEPNNDPPLQAVPIADRYLLEAAPTTPGSPKIACASCSTRVALRGQEVQIPDELMKMKYHLYFHETKCPFYLHNIPEYTNQVLPAIYQPLEPREIRLFILNPGEGEDLLSGRLTCASLDDQSLHYEALSYAWGIDIIRRPIILHGFWFAVTISLFSALRRLRRPTEPRILWVDALCINQQNIQERGGQVSLMGEIYSRCHQCLIWLGGYKERGLEIFRIGSGEFVGGPKLATEDEIFLQSEEVIFHGDDSDRPFHDDLRLEQTTFSAVPEINSQDRESWQHGISWSFDKICTDPKKDYARAFSLLGLLSSEADFTDLPFFRRADGGEFLCSTAWHRCAVAVRDIFFRHWWCRVWIMQEAILTPEATVMLGNISVPFTILQRAILQMTGTRTVRQWVDAFGEIYMSQFWYSPTFSPTNLVRLKARYNENIRIGMIDILTKLSGRSASDPRDYIYGLLSFLPKEWTCNARYPLHPDYTLSAREVFIRATITTIYVDKSLTVLLLKESRDSESQEDLGLPTWVPDWRSVSSRLREWQEHFTTARVSDGRGAKCDFDLRELSPQLTVHAFSICKISKVGRQCLFKLEILHEIAGVMAGWRDLIKQSASMEPLLGSGDREELFLRMVIGDITLEREHTESISGVATSADLDLVSSLLKEMQRDASHFLINSNAALRSLFWERLKPVCNGQVCFVTDEGFVGLGPAELKRGDQVFIVLGAYVPLALRPRSALEANSARTVQDSQEMTVWELIGRCYVPNVMKGELVKQQMDQGLEPEEIILI